MLRSDTSVQGSEAPIVLCDRHSSHCIQGSWILDTGRQRLLIAPKSQQKKGISSLSCVRIKHSDAHRAQRNPSIPFLIGWVTAAKIQSYIYRASLLRVCLPRAGKTIHSMLHHKTWLLTTVSTQWSKSSRPQPDREGKRSLLSLPRSGT